MSFTFLHGGLTLISFFYPLGTDMARMDSNIPVSIFEKICLFICPVLIWPLSVILGVSEPWMIFPGNFGILFVFLNSLAWGIVIYSLFFLFRKLNNRNEQTIE